MKTLRIILIALLTVFVLSFVAACGGGGSNGGSNTGGGSSGGSNVEDSSGGSNVEDSSGNNSGGNSGGGSSSGNPVIPPSVGEGDYILVSFNYYPNSVSDPNAGYTSWYVEPGSTYGEGIQDYVTSFRAREWFGRFDSKIDGKTIGPDYVHTENVTIDLYENDPLGVLTIINNPDKDYASTETFNFYAPFAIGHFMVRDLMLSTPNPEDYFIMEKAFRNYYLDDVLITDENFETVVDSDATVKITSNEADAIIELNVDESNPGPLHSTFITYFKGVPFEVYLNTYYGHLKDEFFPYLDYYDIQLNGKSLTIEEVFEMDLSGRVTVDLVLLGYKLIKVSIEHNAKTYEYKIKLEKEDGECVYLRDYLIEYHGEEEYYEIYGGEDFYFADDGKVAVEVYSSCKVTTTRPYKPVEYICDNCGTVVESESMICNFCRFCLDCCECKVFTCGSCNTTYPSYDEMCSTCGLCHNCCSKVFTCGGCNTTYPCHDEMCTTCGLCYNCCKCNIQTTIHMIVMYDSYSTKEYCLSFDRETTIKKIRESSEFGAMGEIVKAYYFNGMLVDEPTAIKEDGVLVVDLYGATYTSHEVIVTLLDKTLKFSFNGPVTAEYLKKQICSNYSDYTWSFANENGVITDVSDNLLITTGGTLSGKVQTMDFTVAVYGENGVTEVQYSVERDKVVALGDFLKAKGYNYNDYYVFDCESLVSYDATWYHYVTLIKKTDFNTNLVLTIIYNGETHTFKYGEDFVHGWPIPVMEALNFVSAHFYSTRISINGEVVWEPNAKDLSYIFIYDDVTLVMETVYCVYVEHPELEEPLELCSTEQINLKDVIAQYGINTSHYFCTVNGRTVDLTAGDIILPQNPDEAYETSFSVHFTPKNIYLGVYVETVYTSQYITYSEVVSVSVSEILAKIGGKFEDYTWILDNGRGEQIEITDASYVIESSEDAYPEEGANVFKLSVTSKSFIVTVTFLNEEAPEEDLILNEPTTIKRILEMVGIGDTSKCKIVIHDDITCMWNEVTDVNQIVKISSIICVEICE